MAKNNSRIGVPAAIAIVLIIIVSALVFGSCNKDNACLRIQIQTEKQMYIPYEPFLVKFTIENTSGSAIITNYNLFPEYFEIFDEKGNRYSNTVWSSVIMGDTFADGASWNDSEYIQVRYQTVVPGKYTCSMKILNDILNPECPRATESNVIRFEIIEPVGDELSAYLTYLAADSLGRDYSIPKEIRRRNEFEAYLKAANMYPDNIYAPRELYLALIMQSVPDDPDVLIPVGKKLIEHYPESPYGAWAFMHLIDIYKKIGRRGAARDYMNELIEKYSGNVIAERAHYWLEKLQDGH